MEGRQTANKVEVRLYVRGQGIAGRVRVLPDESSAPETVNQKALQAMHGLERWVKELEMTDASVGLSIYYAGNSRRESDEVR